VATTTVLRKTQVTDSHTRPHLAALIRDHG
jgi:hypothetical protein